jgi:hypothetical protein
MSSFSRTFLRDDRFQAFLGNRSHFGLFGKHPRYGDFLKKVLESKALKELEPLVFQVGINRQILSWRKNPNTIAFEHCFLWQRAEQSILGRFWHSADAEHRAEHPLVVCVHTHAVPVSWLCERVLPELERLKSQFVEAEALEQFDVIKGEAKQRLRMLIRTSPTENRPLPASLEARRTLVEHPDLGPKRERFLRIMAAVAAGPMHCASRLDTAYESVVNRVSLGWAQGERPGATHLRVPPCGATSAEALVKWSDFLNYLVGWRAPKLLVLAIGREWLDVLIGEPAPDQFGFLRLPLSEIGYTGDGAPPMEAPLRARAEKVLQGYLLPQGSGLSAGQRIVRVLGVVLIPLLAGVVLAGYLKYSQPQNIPRFLHGVAKRLGNVEIQPNP